MPMHKHACTSTHIKGSVSCTTHPAEYGLHTHKREKQCVTGWNLSALTTAAPSLSCRKEQKKVRGGERRGKSLPSNIFGTLQVACSQLRHIQAMATVLARKTKILGLSLWASSFFCVSKCYDSAFSIQKSVALSLIWANWQVNRWYSRLFTR